MEPRRPPRTDAELVGEVGEIAVPYLGLYTLARHVYAVPETWAHIAQRHGTDFDLGEIKPKIASVLLAPQRILLTLAKPNSILFAGSFSEHYLLIVAVKYLPDELWLATIYKTLSKRIPSSNQILLFENNSD